MSPHTSAKYFLTFALATPLLPACGEGGGAAGTTGPDAAGVDAAPGQPDTAVAIPDAAPDAAVAIPDAAPDAAPLPDAATLVPDASAAPDAAPIPDAAPPPVFPLDHPVPASCLGDLSPGEKRVFSEGFAGGTEGAAFGPDGLYVSLPHGNEIRRIGSDGVATVFAHVPVPIGLAFLSDGRLAVAAAGDSNDVGVPDGSVHLIARDGTDSVLATGIDSPNFITVLSDDSLLVADDFDTRVWHVTLDGQVEAALSAVPSPNGMGFTVARDALFVASTFTVAGELWRYPVDANELPIEAEAQLFASAGIGQTQDGLAIDRFDQIYVARNVPGRIVRYRPDGAGDGTGEPVEVAAGLRTPASLAFGRGAGFDPCSLYVTELLGTRIWRIAVGAEGQARP